MWLWDLETLFGHGPVHALTVMGWYVNAYPVRFTVTVIGLILILMVLAVIAGLLARRFLAERDAAEEIFGTRQSARKKGFLK